jgi:hypothetical protein
MIVLRLKFSSKRSPDGFAGMNGGKFLAHG